MYAIMALYWAIAGSLMSDIKSELGKKIQFIRKARGITQSELGEKIGITQRQITRIECGISFPSAELLEKLCLAMDIPPKQLFNFTLTENQMQSTGTYGTCTYNAVKFGDVFKLELVDKSETSQKILNKNNKELSCESSDAKFSQMAKKNNKPISVAYQEEGETFRVTIYFPDGSIKNIKETNQTTENTEFQRVLKQLKTISDDREKLQFIELAIQAFSDKKLLKKLKNEIDTM